MTSDSSASALPRKRLILFAQDKGGIGKSFVATLLHDFLSGRVSGLKAFDLDHANSTFQRYVPDAEFIDTDVDADKLAVLDRLVEALQEHDVVLADNRAAGGAKVQQYLEESRLTALQGELGFALVFVVIAVDDKDAVSQIADLVDTHGEQVQWLVVRNLRDGAEPSVFMASKTRQRLLALGAIEIAVPGLAEVTRNRLQQANLTVGRGRSAPELHLLDRSRCVRFHERMAEEFGKAASLILP
ncbi:MAG: hypothetical protein JNK23_04350 [Opitutaceae bacterium]|nr:hypothetical protein [Opitutaceae bacterium]